MSFALATVESAGRPQACIELGGRYWPIAASAQALGIAGLGGERPLVALFENWSESFAQLSALAAALAKAPASLALPDGGRVAAPLQYPGKVLCAGANYYDHIAEMGVTDTRKEAQRLFFFFKPPRNALVGPGRTVRKPRATQMFDWEVELAAVIGKRVKDVSEADALGAVAAYSVAIDLSARDLNQAPNTFYRLDWVAGKGQDTCCPMGPRLVPAAFISDPMNLRLGLKVNGETKQDGVTSGMIFSIAEQIATLSRIMTLDPGDVLLTGTPAGVGFPKKTFLSVGDRIDAEIAEIGTLSVEIGA
ncbi:MAG: fumarylacetoacetate hydrolase family protein [Alphaproteobacteria bacterium]|nr:fumarylacetoacetate hydrolase family protein [Alphaproteobacteria bacterium]